MAATNANGAPGMGGHGSYNSGMDIVPKIHAALEVIHSPYSSNTDRQEAQAFLEDVKNNDEAPSHGFNLASDKSQSPVVRHYALSLLEHAIKHKWADYTDEQATALRNWVLELARDISRQDPIYLRNKIAQLWVEVAKRCWVGEWMDMDQNLVQMWQVPDSAVHKELVLLVLETLSDEIFNGDDIVVMSREGILSKASVEIFTPAAVLVETFPKRQPGPDVRCGEEGWLSRIAEFLRQCCAGDIQNNEEIQTCAVRALGVLNSLMPWVIPNAVTSTGCMMVMCEALAVSNVAVQKASLAALYALYNRTSFDDQEFLDLVVPLYDSKYIDLFGRLFEWSVVDADDIDDDKYQFSKLLSELVCSLGTYMDRRTNALRTDSERIDFQGFLRLLLAITQSQSLVVSIPVLVTWTRLLGNKTLGPFIAETPTFIGPLLELCSSRLVRYENLPEDTQDPTFLLLLEDTDTVPERHAFLGNYRRYSSQVIESIVQLEISSAFQHILTQTESLLEHLYDNQPAMNIANYDKFSIPVLRVDAQATVIEAALKGFVKWRGRKVSDVAAHDQQREAMERDLENWCTRLLQMNFDDPLIRKRVLQLLVAFSTTALDKNPQFMLQLLEKILLTWPATHPEHRAYTDAIKELQSESIVELQRLAAKMPDTLMDVYNQIARSVNDMIATGTLDEKRQVTYQNFLFTIIHRTTRVNQKTKIEKLQSFIDPIKASWEAEKLKSSLTSYAGFCELMALDKAQEYLVRKRAHEIKDWGSVPLDAEGQALQALLEARQVSLPLRPTKSLLSVAVEKVEKGTEAYQVSCTLWQEAFPAILPELLKFMNYAHSSHSIENWVGLPPDMRSIVNYVLTDRFWQAGISGGSKDDFYARVVEKKNTMEGLASGIRGVVRFVRESCYAILYCMTKLDMQFYGFSELPGPLAHSLFADSLSLSTHQTINLLTLVRYMVDNCPVQLRSHFLPPILAACFQQMDNKINSEWAKLEQQQGVRADDSSLTEEMKAESILRQLTYTAVMMVADFLDPAKLNPMVDSNGSLEPEQKFPTLRRFCLMQSAIVEPLLVFSTHVIRMRDSRCCGIILRVFRSIITDFQVRASPDNGGSTGTNDDASPIPPEIATAIRDYISSDVMKACISSLHEPYFVDLQKDLAALIASIVAHYSPLTSIPRDVLLSLPNMKQNEVDKAIDFLQRNATASTRQQRSVVLELLRDLKGVSISEMGKLSKSIGSLPSSKSSSSKKTRSKMAEQFMTMPAQPANGSTNTEGEAGLEGVAGLFEG